MIPHKESDPNRRLLINPHLNEEAIISSLSDWLTPNDLGVLLNEHDVADSQLSQEASLQALRDRAATLLETRLSGISEIIFTLTGQHLQLLGEPIPLNQLTWPDKKNSENNVLKSAAILRNYIQREKIFGVILVLYQYTETDINTFFNQVMEYPYHTQTGLAYLQILNLLSNMNPDKALAGFKILDQVFTPQSNEEILLSI